MISLYYNDVGDICIRFWEVFVILTDIITAFIKHTSANEDAMQTAIFKRKLEKVGAEISAVEIKWLS